MEAKATKTSMYYKRGTVGKAITSLFAFEEQ